MSGGVDLGAIEPGMPVFGADGGALGPVEAIEGAGIRVLRQQVPQAAIARVDPAGVHLLLARAAFATLPPDTAGTAAAATTATEGDRLAVPLVEERLEVGTRVVQHGEVQVHKRVVEEQIMVPVRVRRQEVEVIRRGPGEPRPQVDLGPDVEVTYIPLRGEEPVIAVTPVVVREVVIGREIRVEERQVTEMLRATEVTVEEHLAAAYAESRPAFERHFTARQGSRAGAGTVTRTFADAEPHYQAGFRAGRDPRYANQSFDAVAPDLLAAQSAERDPGLLDQIRDEVREGFARARAADQRPAGA